jgi:hypothetical protein
MEYSIRDDEDAIIIFTPLATYKIVKGSWTLNVQPTHYLKISRHNYYVERLIKQLLKQGYAEINADGDFDAPLKRSLGLTCGLGRADVVFKAGEELNYVEVETPERLFEEHTAQQLRKLAAGSARVWLAVPLRALEQARQLLDQINLKGRIMLMEIRD